MLSQSKTYKSQHHTDSRSNSASSHEEETLYDLAVQLKILHRKFKLACKQVVLLNNEIDSLESRYERAHAENSRTFRYLLRFRISTLEGVRQMYYVYCMKCADKLDDLQEYLMGEGLDEEALRLSDEETDDEDDEAVVV